MKLMLTLLIKLTEPSMNTESHIRYDKKIFLNYVVVKLFYPKFDYRPN